VTESQDIPQTPPASRGDRLAALLRRHWWVFAACALAVALRAPFVAIMHSQPASDSLVYVTTARSLAEGHGYSFNGHPTAFFPIGWPAFIAALYLITRTYSFTMVLWAGVGLWAVSTALIYVFGLKLGGRTTAIVAAFIVAAYPDFVFPSLRAFSENLFVPVFIGACILLVPRKGQRLGVLRAAIAGLLLGLAILVRSTAVLLPIALGLWLLLAYRDRLSLKVAVTFVAVAYLVLVPWLVRNEVVMKTLAISTNGGYTLWLGDNPHATGGNAVTKEHPRWDLHSTAREVRDNQQRTKRALYFITHDTAKWLSLIPAKAYYLFDWNAGALERSTDAYNPDPQPRVRERVLTPAEHTLITTARRFYPTLRVVNWMWWLGGFAALIWAIRRRRPGATLVAVVLALWIVIHVTLIHGQFRYMLSVQPLMAAPIAWALVTLCARAWARVRPGTTATAPVR
jgi:4-amino-4-deoxy-L-arabinose transferase-like glycosyltransferase